MIRECLLHVRGIGAITDYQGDVGRVLPGCHVVARAGGQVIQDRDIVLLRGEVVHEVAPNEARTSRNQEFHALTDPTKKKNSLHSCNVRCV